MNDDEKCEENRKKLKIRNKIVKSNEHKNLHEKTKGRKGELNIKLIKI